MIDFNNLPRVHEPQKIEKEIYEWWETQGYFKPEKQRELNLVKENDLKYCITIPPPNVTGMLHLGHAITLSIEDLMARFERMKGKETLYLPGMDHAGIATQNVVERELDKQNINRKDIGREKFIEEVWKWKHKYHAIISEQIRRLGVSCDWSRERFTLDKEYELSVLTAFVQLYKKDLIYKGEYMINWCPGRCESAISDLEAEPHEHESNLWYIKYPIITEDWKGPSAPWGSGKWAQGANEFIELATTRPETLMGDTGVAIAVNHPGFSKFEGKMAVLPVNGRLIPIFEDSYVDPEFGTGALKITPAHDPNDYEIGERKRLEVITILDEKGRMVTENCGKYAGMDRFECREKVVEDLKKENLLSKIEPYTHTVSHCQRCDTIIEPRVSIQWFIRTKTLADKAMEVVMRQLTVMVPEREENRFNQWMENIRDWCISRQLWWGHRIPVWYCSKGHQTCEIEKPTKCSKCDERNLTQDEDVLDTWFSSGLWPFATLGWPNIEAPDYLRYYPTTMRETGYDILFFWVAREMMLGIELTGETPYKDVYFHGIVRNEVGKKISKSMENIEDYDPLNIIAKNGADPLRYTLISSAIPSKDINLNLNVVKSSKNFCNKIWQSTKYVLSNLEKANKIEKITIKFPKSKLNLADKWILSRLNSIISQMTKSLANYDYLNACRIIRSFYWEEFCDWYIEITKIRIYNKNEKDKNTPISILIHVIESCLRLLHPIIPFLTEALWQSLPSTAKEGPALIIANWPKTEDKFIDSKIDEEFEIIKEIIKGIRRVRKEFNVKPGLKIALIINTNTKKEFIERNIPEIATLAHIDEKRIQIGDADPPKRSARLLFPELSIYLPLEGYIDLQQEIERISKKIQKTSDQIKNLEKKLNSQFSEKAAPELVQKEREKLEELKTYNNALKDQLEILK